MRLIMYIEPEYEVSTRSSIQGIDEPTSEASEKDGVVWVKQNLTAGSL
jgi:hypothetical protein